MNKPDFFIVGAPKCGTTSLKQYVAQHPQVFIPPSPPSEPHYFLPKARRDSVSRDRYLSLFKEASGCARAGEKSVWYFSAPEVPGRIADFDSEADIIVMLRNPADMLYSLYYQFRHTCKEDIANFWDALEAEQERRKGRHIPAGCSWPRKLFYSECACFATHLERWFSTFGCEQVCVLIFDDFLEDTAREYEKVLRFLGVDPTFRPEFQVHNPNAKPWSKWLMYLRYHYPDWARELGRILLPSQRIRNAVMRVVTDLNTRTEQRPPMEPKVRQRLQRQFRPEIKCLSEILDRDLMHWVGE